MNDFSPGDAFLWFLPDNSEKLHLCITLASQSAENTVLIVPVNTYKGQKDRSAVLDVGDHPFIKWESVVTFSLSTIVKVSRLRRHEDADILKRKPPVSKDILSRIIAGGIASPLTPNHIKQLLKAEQIKDASS